MPDEEWRMLDFDIVLYWVHVVGLPVGLYTESIGRRLGSLLKMTGAVQSWEESFTRTPFFRL